MVLADTPSKLTLHEWQSIAAPIFRRPVYQYHTEGIETVISYSGAEEGFHVQTKAAPRGTSNCISLKDLRRRYSILHVRHVQFWILLFVALSTQSSLKYKVVARWSASRSPSQTKLSTTSCSQVDFVSAVKCLAHFIKELENGIRRSRPASKQTSSFLIDFYKPNLNGGTSWRHCSNKWIY